MEYFSVKEAAKNWGLTARMVNYYCTSGRIPGVQRIGNIWAIPKEASKPEDGRKGNGRKPKTGDQERDR
nr:DNA-binding protein [Anaerocolumna sp.]